MTDNQQDLKRILEMVETGKVTPEEAEKLIESLEKRGATKTCPYCAESIAKSSVVCPECQSSLGAPSYHQQAHARPSDAGGFHALDGMGKFLVLYTLIICSVVILGSIPFGFGPSTLFQSLLAGLGLASAILIWKGSSSGWGMGMLWSGLQIIQVIVAGATLNKQVLHLGIHFTTNGSGFGLNLVGVVLLILFVKAKKSYTDNETLNQEI